MAAVLDRPRRTSKPTWQVENALWREGCERVAGVDEVGRGPLAGPVVAGAVVLRYSRAGWVRRLRDSKLLDAASREELATHIRRHCDYGIGVVSSHVIDQLGMTAATRLAMRRAVEQLDRVPDALIVDGREVVECETRQRAVIGGDALPLGGRGEHRREGRARRDDGSPRRSLPGYGFARNKGYATAEHREALRRLGHSSVHRLLFAPVREVLTSRLPR